MIDQAITQARDLARGLQPVTVEASGLVDALERLAEKVESMFHVSCLLVCDGPCHVHDNIVGTHLYRIAQEAISNAVKHGQAHTIVIELNVSGDQLAMAVRDDGIGLTRGSGNSQGMGLRSMEYRARVIGGMLTVQPGEKGGTAVVCIVRLNSAAAVSQEGSNHVEEKSGGREA
jgi:signal transduction histidine kinase